MITTDADFIKSVMTHPEIWPRVAEDGTGKAEDWFPNFDGNVYLSDGKTGVFILHWINAVTLECHVQVLPEERQNALKFGKEVLEWTWKNTHAMKIIAQIPFIYMDVVGFAMKNKFIIEGINRQSYLKNGELHDQYYLGLTRAK